MGRKETDQRKNRGERKVEVITKQNKTKHEPKKKKKRRYTECDKTVDAGKVRVEEEIKQKMVTRIRLRPSRAWSG